ncbi:hypothetical protein NFG57_10980 [Halomonas sp. H10-59]|uniref:Uncharacterized protein n=1 Tax=Halomonas sp. H10-59 TaxID=2950874 RepID=A0AAU7KNZ9_9GAMM|nr:hypothetical protein [Halomonas sp. DP1Y21-3]MBY6111158.1 hypothetical protein [Halomonas sp. DP1Y21-3]
MDRDRWETFLEKHLTPADQAFPSVPPVPGDWKTLSPEDSLPLLLDLTQAQLADDIRPTCECFTALAIRAMPLLCYRRHLLCDVLLETEEGPGLFAFIYGQSGVWPLDLTSKALFRLNSVYGDPATSPAAALEYLHLFTGFIIGGAESGRFRVLESADYFPWVDADPPPQALDAVRQALAKVSYPPRVVCANDEADAPAPMTLHSGDLAEQRSLNSDVDSPVVAWHIQVPVVYGRSLWDCDFTVLRDGEVHMEEDRTLLDDLPLRLERFIGAVRLP